MAPGWEIEGYAYLNKDTPEIIICALMYIYNIPNSLLLTKYTYV